MIITCGCGCGETFPALGNKRYYSRACQRRAGHRLDKRTYTLGLSHNKPVIVTYPDVALPDFWTEAQYKQYGGELPPGTKVRFQ